MSQDLNEEVHEEVHDDVLLKENKDDVYLVSDDEENKLTDIGGIKLPDNIGKWIIVVSYIAIAAIFGILIKVYDSRLDDKNKEILKWQALYTDESKQNDSLMNKRKSTVEDCVGTIREYKQIIEGLTNDVYTTKRQVLNESTQLEQSNAAYREQIEKLNKLLNNSKK